MPAARRRSRHRQVAHHAGAARHGRRIRQRHPALSMLALSPRQRLVAGDPAADRCAEACRRGLAGTSARQDRGFSAPPCRAYRERRSSDREPARRALRRPVRSARSLAAGAAKPDPVGPGRAVSRSRPATLRAGGDGGHALDRSLDARIRPPRARSDRGPAPSSLADQPAGRPARPGGPSARDAGRAQPAGSRRGRGDDRRPSKAAPACRRRSVARS